MDDWMISSGLIGIWGATSRMMRLPVIAAVMMNLSTLCFLQSLEKWLRRVSKIFFALKMLMRQYNSQQTIDSSPAKAKNI
jgi:choline-glycine betaine transporter